MDCVTIDASYQALHARTAGSTLRASLEPTTPPTHALAEHITADVAADIPTIPSTNHSSDSAPYTSVDRSNSRTYQT